MPYVALDPSTAAAAPAWTVGAPLTSVGKTLAAMSAEINSRLGGRTDIDPARISTAINDAYLDVASSLDLSELHASLNVPIVAGQPFYLLPSNFSYSTKAELVDTTTYPWQGGTPLDKIDADTYRKLPDDDDQPTAYFIQSGSMLVLYPTPTLDSSVTLECVALPQLLVGDTDSPMLELSLHEGVMLLAWSKMFDSLLEFDNGQLSMNSFVAFMRRRKDRVAAEKSGMIARARGVRGMRDTRNIRRNRSDF
jgi:hypothetical protein